MALVPHTVHTITDRALLERDLDGSRERGFAIDDGEQAADVRSLGAPILGPAGTPVAPRKVGRYENR